MKNCIIKVTTIELEYIAEALEQYEATIPPDMPEYSAIASLAKRVDKMKCKAHGEPEEGY